LKGAFPVRRLNVYNHDFHGRRGTNAGDIPYIPASRYQFYVNMMLVAVASQAQRNSLLSLPVYSSNAGLLKHNEN